MLGGVSHLSNAPYRLAYLLGSPAICWPVRIQQYICRLPRVCSLESRRAARRQRSARGGGLTLGLDWQPANDNKNFSCPDCGRSSSRLILTTCRACYQKRRYESMPQSDCHPDRKEHAGGLFRPCYRTGGRAKRAECHPDRLHIARGLCTECYNNLPENKARNIETRRLRKYGLSESEYEAMLKAQNHKCAICGDTPTAVDHDHGTGEVRGLLCRMCNTGLGHFKDDPAALRTAANYLEERKIAA